MRYVLLGEARKLVNPVIAVVVLVVFAYIWTDMRTTNQLAAQGHGQAAVAVWQSAQFDHELAACRANTRQSINCQDDELPVNVDSYRNFASNGRRLGAVSNALRTWPGVLRQVIHELVSGLGWLLIFAILAVFVAAEWSSGAARYALLASRSAGRLLAAKVITAWLALVLLALVGTSVLYLLSPTVGPLARVPNPAYQTTDAAHWKEVVVPADADWSSAAQAFGWLAVAAVVWLLIIGVGVGLAALVRRGWVTLLAGAVILTAFLVIDSAGALRLAPFGMLARLFHLPDQPFGIKDTRLWRIPGAPSQLEVPAMHVTADVGQALAWVVVMLVAGAACAVGLRLRRVRA